ncbi:unnamed protein product [Miscanthus lutarioriparius]|uniref:Uncharacterized protein n=1 Tax=Miscanthus lutarioriparius TaxID=422564 RepID=A0A811R605_9POAL|nr:unnamed protein product [Miscanthus lutarioriparius]
MTVAVAGGAAKDSPPPVPALERPDCAAAKALTYLCFASMWVGGAGVAAAAFIDLISAGGAYGMGFSVCSALLKLSADAVLFGALLALVVLLLLLRAALRLVVTDLRVDMGMGINKIPRESMGSMLGDTAVIGWLASLLFLLLSLVGCLVLIALSPAKGSLTVRISTAVIDVGILGSMVLSCFVTIPSMALKLWRMSPEGDAPADNIV